MLELSELHELINTSTNRTHIRIYINYITKRAVLLSSLDYDMEYYEGDMTKIKANLYDNIQKQYKELRELETYIRDNIMNQNINRSS